LDWTGSPEKDWIGIGLDGYRFLFQLEFLVDLEYQWYELEYLFQFNDYCNWTRNSKFKLELQFWLFELESEWDWIGRVSFQFQLWHPAKKLVDFSIVDHEPILAMASCKRFRFSARS